TLMSGCSCKSFGTPSSPDSPGITTSMRTRSGFVVRASKIASRTFPASPTVSMSISASMSSRSPERTTAWSSTTRTRINSEGNLDRDRRPGARRRLDAQRAAEQLDAFAHPLDAEPVPGPLGVEPEPVVLDHERHALILTGHENADLTSLRMLDDVREPFLDNPIERRRDLAGKLLHAGSRGEVDGQTGLLPEVPDEPVECSLEPEVVER